jgi:molybdopterin-binding protein
MAHAKLFKPREAAQISGISYPTLKQWIYKNKLQTVRTAGGHHRVPESQIDKFLHVIPEPGSASRRRPSFRRICARNQLIGRVIGIRTDGLVAEVTIFIGGQRIHSIVTADALREMRLKAGQTIAALVKSTDVMLLRP